MSPLVEYVMHGLRHCYMPEQRCWSYIYHLDGRPQPNQSVPYYDSYYSLNVILGLARLGPAAWQGEYDLPAILQEQSRRALDLPGPVYAIGMALWAAAELGVAIAPDTLARMTSFIRNHKNWPAFRAQDAGLILTGLCAQSARGNTDLDPEAHDLAKFICDRYLSASGLFYDEASGLRRNFSSFATHTYLTTALYHYGTHFNREDMLQRADNCTRKLISLQGPLGEWPWFYFTPAGRVVDCYEVYAVHQDGMAPLFLEFAERRGVAGAREAIIKGFKWIYGDNQRGHPMMVPEKGLFIRSILRKGELHNKRPRMLRAMCNALLCRNDAYVPREQLDLRLECRSYHLGFVLYSFGHREDLPDITHHPLLTPARAQGLKQ